MEVDLVGKKTQFLHYAIRLHLLNTIYLRNRAAAVGILAAMDNKVVAQDSPAVVQDIPSVAWGRQAERGN